MLDDDHNNNFAAGNATNVVGVWAAREVLKSTLEFTQGVSIKELFGVKNGTTVSLKLSVEHDFLWIGIQIKICLIPEDSFKMFTFAVARERPLLCPAHGCGLRFGQKKTLRVHSRCNFYL